MLDDTERWKGKKMKKEEIIKILVKGFEEKLKGASDALLYSIYAEYLNQLEELKKIKEGVKTDEV